MKDTGSELVERVLRPLLCGGMVCPLRPIGARRARELASDAEGVFELDGELAAARLREARRLWPVDELPALGVGEWLLLAALNDLLQVNNPDLMSAYARHRPARLLEMARDCIVAAGPPKTAAEALARHATFSRVVALERPDTLVRWWAGERWFIGAPAPPRLMAWPKLRRVQARTRRIGLAGMAGDAVWAPNYRHAVRSWLSATPITELVHGELTATGLSLVAHPTGRALAGRALERSGRLDRVLRIARRAAQELEGETGQTAAELVRELEQRAGRAG